MINLELLAQSGDYSVVQICTIVCDDPVGDTIPAYEVLLDEAGNHILRNIGKGSCLDPLGEIVNSNQDEAMSVGRCGLDLSNHVNTPHCKWTQSGHDIQRDRRHMDFVSVDFAFVTSS